MLNKVMLMGRICKDLELKYSASNVAVLNFTLAIDREYVKQGEEKQADLINCVAFGKTAEFIQKYFGKGRLLLVKDSRIQTRAWDDRDGNKRYVTEVVVDKCGFTGEKKQDSQGDAHETAPSQAKSDAFYPVSEDDEELPF